MAIHVKELVIRANVGMDAQDQTSSEAAQRSQPESSEKLVKQAVSEVMRMMKDKKNR